MSGRATVVGVGLIGGSIGLALRERGWHVSGVDPDEARLAMALGMGVIDEAGWDDWVGCEYRPKAATLDGLGWMKSTVRGGRRLGF